MPATHRMPAPAIESFEDLFSAVPLFEERMRRCLDQGAAPANLSRAMQYALLAGGKRLRPMLVRHACAAIDASLVSHDCCLAAGAAVEMIHAFSLVHDDLPALDNDDMRRGRPTLHKAQGEAMAILAGDGLMAAAFQALAAPGIEPALGGLLVRELAEGTTGMIEGQVLDTLGGFEPQMPEPERVRLVHVKKTGALIRAACRMGAICGGFAGRDPGGEGLEAVTAYGEAIGLMFQIVDDLIDVEQSAEQAGKRTGKDAERGKLTYPAVFGVEASRAEVERLRAEARESVRMLGERADALRRMCDYLASRTR